MIEAKILRISKGLTLPDEAVTQTFAILAKRGMGKTYTGAVMAEEMLKQQLQVIVVDPVGVWYGLRSSADGKHAGLEILIAGGEHGDIPITADNGEVLANLVVDNRLSIILDLSLFRKNETVKFMTDFAETLYRRNRTAVHLFLDEADQFAPQRPMPNEARMLGAIEDIVRRGRARGIGVTMITQRPSVLNKNVLTQIEVLIALRLTAPLDQKAIDEWVKTHAEEDQRAKFMTSLPSLPIGEAWFWSPGWLEGMFKRVKIRKRETLDSSSTPKAGQAKITAQKMTSMDLDKLREQLSLTIEKVESADPKVLRQRIVKLEQQIKDQKPDTIVTQVEVLPPGLKQRLQDLHHEASRLTVEISQLIDWATKFSDASDTQPQFQEVAVKLEKIPTNAPEPGYYKKAFERSVETKSPADLKAGEIRMLEVLGRGYPLHFTRAQMASLAKMKVTGGTFGTYYGNLKRNGYLEEIAGNIKIGAKGLQLLGIPASQPAKTPAEKVAMWRSVMRAGEARIFDTILSQRRRGISRDTLAELVGMSPSGGTFGTYLGTLRRNKLIETDGDTIRVADGLVGAS